MNEKNPWTIRKKETVYDNQWIRLDVHDVLNPKGNPGIYGVVHFKQIAIGVLAINEQDEVYLVGQYRFPLNEYSWEIPEGGGLLPVDPLESARRELLEETGLMADTWTRIADFVTSNSVTDERAIIFVAKNLTQMESNPDDEEELQVKKIPFDQLYQSVMNDELKDSLTVVAVLKTKLLRDSGKL